jgi:isoleucyl-tRNA synthetase
MTEATEKRSYKKTLNLPRTDFPMRANLAQSEPASLERWQAMDLPATIDRARADRPAFAFHDGPPYANASIHVGHLLNKVLKDVVVRSRLMAGRRCRFIPGWDCHGLPIEHKVMTELVESGKAKRLDALDADARRMSIRRQCKAHAEKFVALHTRQLRRLLTLADYDHPYLTLQPEYERAVLEVFADLVERGLVYRDLKPVHWSIANQTALAEAELEYEERTDRAVYVDFEAADRAAVGRAFGIELDATPSFMIWTTTPWTLPANLAIAVAPRFMYVLVEIDGSLTVVARDLLERVRAAARAEDVRIVAEAPGSALLGRAYRHPFCDRTGRLVSADYVTLEDGTGLVHTAPGHGTEDYVTGRREGLDVYCPVRDDGTFDDTAPAWLRGRSVWDANPIIVERLRESGHLVAAHDVVHSYPHDWRSKTPVIFRATEQWFVAVDRPFAAEGTGGTSGARSLRDRALEAAEREIAFYPEWGRNRLRGMLEARPDWCLSRQRAWGLPIPAFTRADGSMFLTAASVRAVAAAIGERGSDAWFTETPAQLLARYEAARDPDAPAGLDVRGLRKASDIFDVWFESGSSWNAVMRQRALGFPADLYLEGSDQHRGWFQLSLLPALGATGRSPFRSVLTHGFVVDKDGRKMSKSLGNAIEVEDLLRDFGAEVCRWWVSSLAFENDVRMDRSFLEQAGESYRKVRNTLRFLLSNLDDFFPCTRENPAGMCVDLGGLDPASLDAYVLAEAAQLQARVREAYEGYEFRRAHQLLFDFCNDTLSALYCAAVKDRLYCDKPDSPRRRATQTVMWDLVEMLTRLLAPILPHTADEAFRSLWRAEAGDTRCVHLMTFADPPAVRAHSDWPAVLAARERALKALELAKASGIENPLDAEVVLPDPDGVLAPFARELPDLLGVSRVAFDRAADGVRVRDLRGEPRCERSWKRDGTVRRRSDGGMLSDRDADAVGVR